MMINAHEGWSLKIAEISSGYEMNEATEGSSRQNETDNLGETRQTLHMCSAGRLPMVNKNAVVNI